jgi:Fatty acid desaturase
MGFETKREVLDWYEKQPRALTDEFIGNIAWHDVKKYELDERLIPVLFYMRDVESLTDVYYREMLRTPTGKDPVIGKFMERWGVEELAHGELLNRFLSEAGIPTEEKWREKVKKAVPLSYTLNTHLVGFITGLIGKKFTATHMTFGAIHEMSTGQGYRRLINMANHPVLTHILKAILREESAHTRFYANVAQIELRKNETAQKIARFIVKHFWTPVGQGSKPKKQTDYAIGTLFNGEEGIEWFDRNVSQKLQSFPGFDGLTKITERIAQIQDGQFA